MEKLAKINDVAAVTAADYEELYAAYEDAVSKVDYWKGLYEYVGKESVANKCRFNALAHMVNNAAELVQLLN